MFIGYGSTAVSDDRHKSVCGSRCCSSARPEQGFGRNPLSLREHHRQTLQRTGVLAQKEGEISVCLVLVHVK